jgi:hypothetical protein
VRVPAIALIVSLIYLLQPGRAEACGCTGTVSSAVAFERADLVFVGTVARVDTPAPWSRVNGDGSVSGGSGTGPTNVTFTVAHAFRGGRLDDVVIPSYSSSCDLPFKLGETWLVYANWGPGGIVTTHTCTRTRLRADASQDLVYLEGIEQGRPQAIAYGEVLRKIAGNDRQPALQALFEPLQVIAVGDGLRFETTTDKWGPYQIVLPPGDFQVWVERAGRIVGSKQIVHIEDKTNRYLQLVADYKN